MALDLTTGDQRTRDGHPPSGQLDERGSEGRSRRRVNATRVLAGLRHFQGATDPGPAFSDVVSLLVPAFCDEAIVHLVEDGGSAYRIRRPGGTSRYATLRVPTRDGGVVGEIAGDEGSVIGDATGDEGSLWVPIPEQPSIGPGFGGFMICVWHDGYRPTAVDETLLELTVERAVGLVYRERLVGELLKAQLQTDSLQRSVDLNRQIGAAVGTLMAARGLGYDQALDLLIRTSRAADRELSRVAEFVLDTGTLPE